MLRSIVLSALVLESLSTVGGVYALTPNKEISQDEGTRNEYAVLKYLWPALKQAKKAGRISYVTACQADVNYPAPFPKINVEPPAKGVFGLAAVREIFQYDTNIEVTEKRSGLIMVKIGNAPSGILGTKISSITFWPIERYNPQLAISAIEGSEDVRAAMRKLDIHAASRVSNQGIVMPANGLPHLLGALTKVTMDQALDLVAHTFGGIVVYAACSNSNLYTIDFTGGAGFDESKLP